MHKRLLTAITLLGLTSGASAAEITPIHLISYSNAPYTVTAVALDSVQNDDNVTSMTVFVSVTDADGAPVRGLPASDFTTYRVAGTSVSGINGEYAPGVYGFQVNTTLDPFGVQGRSAVAMVQVRHTVMVSATMGVIYQGQALARADFSRACK